MAPPTPAEVAADKATIDTDLMRLVQASKQKIKLPSADPAPTVGPYSHLRAAMKIMKRAHLLKQIAGFEDSWLDLVLREQQGLERPYVNTLENYVSGRSKKAAACREIAKVRSLVALVNARNHLLVLSPLGPGAAVLVVDDNGMTTAGRSVADFVHREVARLLGDTLEPVAVAAPSAEARASAQRYAKLVKSQPRAEEIRGSLAVAWCVTDLKCLDDVAKLDDVAREAGLSLMAGFGDAASVPASSALWLSNWLVGVELATVRGGTEQQKGFSFDAKALAAATAKLDAVTTSVRKLGKASRGVFVVARGGLAQATLVKGAWVLPPTAVKRDPGALATWLETKQPAASATDVGYVRGTRGATQDAFPGAVHGLAIGTANQCAEAVDWSERRDKALDAKLAKAGIADAQYFLVTRFD